MAGDRGSHSFGITTRLIRVRKNLWGALAICAAVLVVGWGTARLAQWRIDRAENRRVEVVWGEIEARSPVKTPPVLVMGGSVADREFELVMRGFTNYCLKETWGADRGERTNTGRAKSRRLPGGHSYPGILPGNGGVDGKAHTRAEAGPVSKRARKICLPGRWLWNRTGFVGVKASI